MIKTLEKFFLEFCHPSFASDVELMTNQRWLCLIKVVTLELPVQLVGSSTGHQLVGSSTGESPLL